VVEPGAKILHRSPVFYPPGVTATGVVIVESTVNAKGEVTDARVVSGPEELRNAALASVLNWHFSTDGGLPPMVQSTIRFEAAPRMASAAAASATPALPRPKPLNLKSIDTSGLPEELAEKVRAALPVREGDPFGNDDLAKVRAAVKEVDEHLTTGIRISDRDATLLIGVRSSGITGGIPGGIAGGIAGGVPGGVAGGVVGGVGGEVTAVASAPQFAAPASGVQRVRVGGNVISASLVKKVTPLYPPVAKQARIQGTVRFNALIGMDGSIMSLQLVSGHPLLVESARDAVAQWQYKPVLLDGNPVEVITQIDVNYTLSQ
jgi:protein TonB